MILVDTSVWIEVLRKKSPLDLESIVEFDEIVTCLPVIQEILQGIQNEEAYRTAEIALWNLPMVEAPMGAKIYDRAIDLYRTARRAGFTVRSSVDCLIAACALSGNLTLLHRDRDFEALASVSRLRQRNLSRRQG